MPRKLRLSVHRKNQFRKERAKKRKHTVTVTPSLPVSIVRDQIILCSKTLSEKDSGIIPETLPPTINRSCNDDDTDGEMVAETVNNDDDLDSELVAAMMKTLIVTWMVSL